MISKSIDSAKIFALIILAALSRFQNSRTCYDASVVLKCKINEQHSKSGVGTFFLLVGLCFAFFALPKPGHANTGEDFQEATRFVDGLLQRGLFSSAELYCDEQIRRFANHANNKSSLIFYVSEKVNVLTRFALTQPDLQRQEILRRLELWEKQWNKNINEAKFDETTDSCTDVFRFPLQLAISDQMLGELFRYEEEVHPEKRFSATTSAPSNPLERTALQTVPQSEVYLNQALDQMQILKEKVERISGTGKNTRKQAQELLAIERQIEFRTALTWRTFAIGGKREISVVESPEKIDALQRAVRGFTNLATLSGKDPIILQSRLERIICLRLLLELDEATRAWEKLMESKSDFTKEFLIQVTAETIRLDLAKGDIAQAIRRSGFVRPDQNTSGSGNEQPTTVVSNYPDFELARLESALSQWRLLKTAERQTSQAQQSQPWLERSLAFVEVIGQNFGPYWGRRAQMLLAKAAKNQATDNFQVYVQLAEDAYRRNRFDEAVNYYDFARSGAETQKDDESAFQLALAAASIESTLAANERNLATHRKKYGTNETVFSETLSDLDESSKDSHERTAMERFCEAAKHWATRKEAEEIYLYGISHAGRLLTRGEIDNSEMIDRLLEFMKLWPNSPKKSEIACRTAVLLEREGRFEETLQICPEFEGRAKTTLEIRKLVQENRIDDALALAKSVCDKNPESLELQIQYGELLANTDRPDRLRTALEFWRNLEKQLDESNALKTQNESDPALWKAKEMMIRIHEKLGNRQQAKKMLDLQFLFNETRWNAEQKEHFEKLRNQLSH